MPETSSSKHPTQEELQKLFDERGREFVVAYAARAAWRAFIYIGYRGEFDFWGTQAEKHLHGVMAALLSAWENSFTKDSHKHTIGVNAADAADDAYAAADDADDAYTAAAYAAADAAYTAADADDAAYTAAYTAADADAAAYTAADADADADDARADYEYLCKAQESRLLFQRPLWQGEVSFLSNYEDRFQKACKRSGIDLTGIWKIYTAIRDGKEFEIELAQRIVKRWEELSTEEENNPKQAADSKSEIEEVPIESVTSEEIDAEEDSPESEVAVSPETTSPRRPSGSRAPALRDEPASKDLLGREHLVNALALMFTATEQGTPFTIGLLGDWGVGKSSFLKQLRENIQNRIKKSNDSRKIEFDFAEFNAWEYEKTEMISAGLAQQVVQGIVNGTIGFRGKLALGLRFAWYEHRAKLFVWLGGILALLGVGLAIWRSPDVRGYIQQILGLEEKSQAGLPAVTFLVVMLGSFGYVIKSIIKLVDHPLTTQFQTFLKLPDFKSHLGVIPILKKQLDRLCAMQFGYRRISFYKKWYQRLRINRQITKWDIQLTTWSLRRNLLRWIASKMPRHRRLIVFVDDLDRCQPDCIVDTLDAVRLIMDRQHVIVVIAIDHRIALKAVAENYKSLADKERSPEDIARDYLGKIIQLPIRLQDPGEEGLKMFVEQKLFPDIDTPVVAPLESDTTAKRMNYESFKSDASLDPEFRDRHSQDIDQIIEDSHSQTAGPSSSESEFSDSSHELPKSLTDSGQLDSDQVGDTQYEAENEDENLLVHTASEQGYFYRFAQILSIDNPRRLIRLRNSYRLLKACAKALDRHFDEANIPDEDQRGELLLATLFWNEFMGTIPNKYRGGFSAYVNGETKSPNSRIINQLKDRLRNDSDRRDRIAAELENVRTHLENHPDFCDAVRTIRHQLPIVNHFVESLVLPRKNVEDVSSKKSSSDAKEAEKNQ